MNCSMCRSTVAPGVTRCLRCGAPIVPAMLGDYVPIDTATERMSDMAHRVRPLVPPPANVDGVAGHARAVVPPAVPRPPIAGFISVPPSIHAPVGLAAPAQLAPLPPPPAVPGRFPAQPPIPDPTAIDDETRVAPRRMSGNWQLVLPTGERLPLLSSVVVGREPTASLVRGAGPLAVNDPDKSLSKSHAAFELSEMGLTVRDLASTNGVIVVGPDGDETEVYGSIAVPLRPGSTVELGSFVIRIEVDSA